MNTRTPHTLIALAIIPSLMMGCGSALSPEDDPTSPASDAQDPWALAEDDASEAPSEEQTGPETPTPREDEEEEVTKEHPTFGVLYEAADVWDALKTCEDNISDEYDPDAPHDSRALRVARVEATHTADAAHVQVAVTFANPVPRFAGDYPGMALEHVGGDAPEWSRADSRGIPTSPERIETQLYGIASCGLQTLTVTVPWDGGQQTSTIEALALGELGEVVRDRVTFTVRH